jgi:prolyl-tRNA synthetase
MTKKTKTTLLIATTCFFVLVATFAYALYMVRSQGSALDSLREQIAEDTAKDAAYNSIVRITESSKLNRAELEEYFITEKDTIRFIAELEDRAARVGVTFETTELSTPEPVVAPDATTPVLRTLEVGCKFTGSEAAVKQFLVILENIPYHAEIPTMTISNDATDGKWVGNGKLILTIKP